MSGRRKATLYRGSFIDVPGWCFQTEHNAVHIDLRNAVHVDLRKAVPVVICPNLPDVPTICILDPIAQKASVGPMPRVTLLRAYALAAMA